MPIINGFDDMIDIEQEIHATIDDIFINKKEKIDFNTFYDLIIRKERYELFIPLISFFYDNKPFNNEEINEFYSEYYISGKKELNGGNYKIKNVVNFKEFETKEEIQENKIFKMININNGLSYRYKSPSNSKIFKYNNNEFLKLNKTAKKSNEHFGLFKNINADKINHNDINVSNDDLDNEEKNYEKYILNSNAFDRMRKSLPIVTGNSNILNLKSITKNKNKEKKEENKNYSKNIDNKINMISKRKYKHESIILNFCQNVIKNNCMTFNDEIDNYTEDNDSISLQKSVGIKLDYITKDEKEIPWKTNIINISKQKIKCESYLYKLTKSGKMKKLYFKLYNYDLFYYKNENSKLHKGMHNLSTYFLELKSVYDNDKNRNCDSNNLNFKYNQKYSQYKKTINGIDYYYFLLINVKNEIHYYYTPSLQIYKEWTNNLKILLIYN